jgi:hypothetical protein
LKRLAAAGLALTLAACAGAGEPVPAAAPSSAGQIATTAPVPAASTAAPAPTQSTPQIAAAPIAGVRGLMGLTREALATRLGQAGFVRRDGPAEVLRYRGQSCLLDVFVYRETDGAQRVAHVDARTLQGRPTPPDPCLDTLEKEKKG